MFLIIFVCFFLDLFFLIYVGFFYGMMIIYVVLIVKGVCYCCVIFKVMMIIKINFKDDRIFFDIIFIGFLSFGD